MGQPISSVVKVNVVRGTRSITRAGFGTPLVVADAASFTGIRSYASINEVLEDFLPDSLVYKAALRLFSAEQKPPVIKVGMTSGSTPPPRTINLRGSSTSGSPTLTDVVGLDGDPISDADFAAIKPQIGASSASYAGVTKIVSVDRVAKTVTFDVPAADTDTGVGVNVFVPGVLTADAPVVALQKLVDLDLDFYGVVIASRDDAAAYAVAEYIETQRKLFYYSTDDAAAFNADADTDFLAKVKAANFTRTIGLYSGSADAFAEAALVSDELPRDPGSYTMKFKTLVGIPADKLSTSQINAIKGKNGNVYTTVGGTDIVAEGKVAMGEFIDVIRFIDWQQAQIEENIFGLLVSSPKVPMTDKGIAMIEGQLRLALDAGVNVGGLDSYTVQVPKLAEIPQADRQARRATGMKFNGKLAGAIHFGEIDGTVTV